jgi:hypothetical protein
MLFQKLFGASASIVLGEVIGDASATLDASRASAMAR